MWSNQLTIHTERFDRHIPMPDLLPMQLLISRKEHLIVIHRGEFVVIFDIESQKHYSLSVIGSRIWKAIDRPITIGQLVEVLCQRFEWEQATCELIVIYFVLFLSQEKLIIFQIFTYN